MNPWELIRREIDGAVRSVRYDLETRRERRAMREQTEELPVITTGRASKGVILATTAGLAVAGSISGYVVFTGGLDSLFARGDAPAGLPTSPAKPNVTGSPTKAAPAKVTPTSKGGPKVPVALNSPIPPRPISPSATPTVSPPVPTPAPTCHCVTPSPTGSASPSASPTPSATSAWPTTTPTSAATR